MCCSSYLSLGERPYAQMFEDEYNKALADYRSIIDEEYTKYLVVDAEIKGTYELLWETFGGSVNSSGFKVLLTSKPKAFSLTLLTNSFAT